MTKKTSSKKPAAAKAPKSKPAPAPAPAPVPEVTRAAAPAPAPPVAATTSSHAPLIAWAESCLRRAAGETPPAAARPTDGPVIAVGRIFGLTEIEVAALQLVHAVERSLGLMARARALAGGAARGLTVEVLRAAIGPAIDAALAPGQTLRRHALLVLDDAGAVSATSEVRLGAGLGARLDGRTVRGELGPAVMRVAASEGAALPSTEPRAQAIAFELAREENDVNRLVTVAGCGRREGAQLAGALIARLQRGVVLVDGEALAGAGRPWETLQAARRDADLDGDILVVVEAQAAGAAWRAACSPPPTLAPRPILCVLAESGPGREALLLEGLRLKAMTLGPVATATAAAATTPAAAATAEKKPDDGFDEIRQMAVRDAERALGIIRPTPAPRPSVPGTISTSRPLPPVTVLPPTPPQPEPAPVVATPPPTPAPTPAPAPVAATPPPATPTPAAPPPAPAIAAPKGKMSAKARAMLASVTADDHADVLAHLAKMRARDEAAAAAPPADGAEAAPAPAPEAPAATTPATAPATATPSAPPPVPGGLTAAEIAAAEAQPYLEVAADAPVAVLARVAQTSPNPKQRVEILQSLHRVRDPAAMAAMRANAQSAHPDVRAVAETGMQLLFGPAWNTSRPVPKPVQPPRTDDGKDRGPPGGW